LSEHNAKKEWFLRIFNEKNFTNAEFKGKMIVEEHLDVRSMFARPPCEIPRRKYGDIRALNEETPGPVPVVVQNNPPHFIPDCKNIITFAVNKNNKK